MNVDGRACHAIEDMIPMMLLGKLRSRESRDDPTEETCEEPVQEERMVVRERKADGSIRYVVTDALLRRAAKAASRKNFEAA